MRLEFLKRKEKKEIIQKLEDRYGITNVPLLLFKIGKEKIRGYTGLLSKDEIITLNRNMRVEKMGLYLFKEEKDEIRMTVDAIQLLKKQIKKNILEINKEQKDKWLDGKEIEVDTNLFGFYVIKSESDFLGCGKASQGKMINFLPKERLIAKSSS